MRKPASFYFFRRKPIVQKDRHERWRAVGNLYYTAGEKNVAQTAKYFGISRKTFCKWPRRFKDSKYNVKSLADQSKAPHHKRKWEITLLTNLLKTCRQIMEVSLPASLKRLPPG